MQTGDTSYTYRNDLDKACFQHHMAYDKYKNLERRTQSDKVLKDKAFEIASNPKHHGYQRELASMIYKSFNKKPKRTGIKNEIKKNQQLANELYKPVIRMFRKRVYLLFKDNIWGLDLADIQINKQMQYRN